MSTRSIQIPVTSPETSQDPTLHFNVDSVEELNDQWGNSDDPILYRGHDLLELYVNSDRLERAALGYEEEDERERYSGSGHPRFWDDTSISCKASKYSSRNSGQEVMLLYMADTDVFVNGWDIFTDEGGEHADVYFKITNDGEIIIVDLVRGDGIVYSETGSYRQHRKIKNIIEIRLD